jgi:hypothetical protein
MRLALLLVFFVTNAFAQEFRKIRVEIGFGSAFNYPGYNYPRTTALLAYFDPSYRLNNKIRIGFKMEVALGGIVIGSYGPNFQYYFFNKAFRPFVGLGIGFYHPGLPSNGSTGTGPYSTDEETSFGFYPRVGFDWRHITLTVDYNIAATSKAKIHYNGMDPMNATNGHLENNYLGLKLGVFIGGGRKKK